MFFTEACMDRQTESLARPVGVAGGGHLGRAVALALLESGLEADQLMISYGGSPHTLRALEAAGLGARVTGNERMFERAGTLILTVRPADLRKLPVPHPGAWTVSCAAGVSLAALRRQFGGHACRAMLSGPDSILSKTGVGTIWPECRAGRALLSALRVGYIPLDCESDMEIFTAGICLPAASAFMELRHMGREGLRALASGGPLLSRLCAWAEAALPPFSCDEERMDYVARYSTEGGVTRAMLAALEGGASPEEAFRRGVARVREIAMEVGGEIGRVQ